MFDELIIPAARLLDTVETKLKDVRLKNVTNRIEENTVAKQAITTILPPTIISNKQEQKSPIPLSNYKTVVYEESELIEWGRNNRYQDHQSKQVMNNVWVFCRQKKRRRQMRRWSTTGGKSRIKMFESLFALSRIAIGPFDLGWNTTSSPLNVSKRQIDVEESTILFVELHSNRWRDPVSCRWWR